MSSTLDGGDESINPYAAPQASLSLEPALLTGDVARRGDPPGASQS